MCPLAGTKNMKQFEREKKAPVGHEDRKPDSLLGFVMNLNMYNEKCSVNPIKAFQVPSSNQQQRQMNSFGIFGTLLSTNQQFALQKRYLLSFSILKRTFFSHFLQPVSTVCFRSSLLLSLAPPTRAFLSPPSPLSFQNTMFPGLFGETVEINKLEGSRTALLRTTVGSSRGKTNKKAGWGDGSVVPLFHSAQAHTLQSGQYTLKSSDEHLIQKTRGIVSLLRYELKKKEDAMTKDCYG